MRYLCQKRLINIVPEIIEKIVSSPSAFLADLVIWLAKLHVLDDGLGLNSPQIGLRKGQSGDRFGRIEELFSQMIQSLCILLEEKGVDFNFVVSNEVLILNDFKKMP